MQGDDESARESSEQALAIAQEIGHRRLQGYAMNNLGHALAGLRQLEEAGDAYRQAVDLRRELGEHYLAIDSLAGLARVSLAQNNLPRALTQVEEILSQLESNPKLDGAEESFRVFLSCYHVLHTNADPRARDILATAHRLLQERAAKIPDKEKRRSFLENVQAHRDIVRAWQAADLKS